MCGFIKCMCKARFECVCVCGAYRSAHNLQIIKVAHMAAGQHFSILLITSARNIGIQNFFNQNLARFELYDLVEKIRI